MEMLFVSLYLAWADWHFPLHKGGGGGGKGAVPLGKMLPSTPQPEGKPLTQWDSQATEAPPNAQAKFTDGWVKPKPMVSTGLLWLFSVNASCEECKTDVVALLRRQNSKPPSQLQPVGLVNLVLFLLTLAADNA